jgi:hypothetical protein
LPSPYIYMSKIVERKPNPVPTEPSDVKLEKELIINSTPTEVEIALLENGKLVELHYQKTNTNFTVGDIFVGRIRKLMPGLNAAFVDIGHKKTLSFITLILDQDSVLWLSTAMNLFQGSRAPTY